jgi:endonuclease YncB( thermonuclease family)
MNSAVITRLLMRRACLLLVNATLMSGPFQASAAEPIVGQATVIDGDTIMIRSQRIRLAGMDAFEARQTCQDAAGKDYPCGRDAAFALDDFIGRRNVNCEPKDRSWGRIVAICSVDDEDLGAWMVQQGHAVDDDRYISTKLLVGRGAGMVASSRSVVRLVRASKGLAGSLMVSHRAHRNS